VQAINFSQRGTQAAHRFMRLDFGAVLQPTTEQSILYGKKSTICQVCSPAGLFCHFAGLQVAQAQRIQQLRLRVCQPLQQLQMAAYDLLHSLLRGHQQLEAAWLCCTACCFS
jgi:hypothetical protein